MKKLLLILRVSIGLLAGAAIVTVPSGCQMTPRTIAYNTLYSVEKSTTAAYDAYLDLVIQGKVKRDGMPSVAKAFNRFQVAMQGAVNAAQFNYNAIAPETVVALANEVLNAILKAKEL
jgi:hypothetical protein